MYQYFRNKTLCWICLISILLQACQIRKAQTATNQPPTRFPQPFNFYYLTIHASLHIADGPIQYRWRVQFRIQRDKLIWFSVTTPWGIEVARGCLTPNCIEIINHLQHTYTKEYYPSLQAKWQLPCSYDFLQAILLGDLPTQYSNFKEYPAKEYTIIQQKEGPWSLQALIKNSLGKIANWHLRHALTQAQCSVYYEQFETYPPGLLFKHARLYLAGLVMQLTYNRIQCTEKKLKFPFRIPKQYVNP